MTGLLGPEPRVPPIPGTSSHVVPGDNREIFINLPCFQSVPLRLGTGTACFWGAWLVFWRPVVLVVSRASGISNTSGFLELGDGFRAFLNALPWCFNKGRRSSRPPVTRAALAVHFQVGAKSIPVHIGNNRIEISYAESGRILGLNPTRASSGDSDA